MVGFAFGQSPPETLLSAWTFAKDSPGVATLLALIPAYLSGVFLQETSKSGLVLFRSLPALQAKKGRQIADVVFARLLLLQGSRTGNEKYSSALASTLKSVCDKLKATSKLDINAEKSDDDRWRLFRLLAKAYLNRSDGRFLVDVFQNKYTLHRSLATASAIVGWLALLAFLSYLVARLFGCLAWNNLRALPLFGVSLVSVLLVRVFSRSYSYFWLLWGDTLIAETFVEVSLVGEKKP
jgi:hypothetical protein